MASLRDYRLGHGFTGKIMKELGWSVASSGLIDINKCVTTDSNQNSGAIQYVNRELIPYLQAWRAKRSFLEECLTLVDYSYQLIFTHFNIHF